MEEVGISSSKRGFLTNIKGVKEECKTKKAVFANNFLLPYGVHNI